MFDMKKELEKVYKPSEIEDRIYNEWIEKGYFTPEIDRSKKPFSLVIPPPNVTGQLHMGHALDETLQDTLVRYKRMQGYCTLWVPGTDHAGIATQIKVEENLRKNEGLTRYDLGREKFLERVWDWKNQYGNRIINQLKKLGSSCDFTRERFTMDEGCSRAVREVFVNLYEKGLIYRGYRIINWCPHCRTALSDAEVEYSEKSGAFWHIRYQVKDSDRFLTVATTRPETMLGDTAVAVHPEDERYTDLVGKTLILPLLNREIPIVADEYVEKDFGTGCVKITPAHDPNDFEVGQRHNLECIRVIDDDAKISYDCKYKGMDRYEARKAIVEDLEKEGYLEKVEDYTHNVGTCYRCKTVVEPVSSDQWFVRMKPLAEPAIKAVRDGEIKFVPERFTKTYMNWMENIHDWCISRQLWWGHRIPAFYCDECGETFVSKEDMTVCPKCGAALRQEEDVLDTWFSSALWPFETLGWPDKTEDYDYFYPTSTLVTGYDIISFWVSRMIFSGLEHTGTKPFDTVLIHGLVRDAQGRKMSKSVGNGIDPLEIIASYGADALRFALLTGNAPGNDMRFSDEKIEAARNFCNKIWNSARFTLMNLDIDEIKLPEAKELALADRWILTLLERLISGVTESLDKYELGIALGKLYDFIWDNFCDWYIELAKPRLADKDSADGKVAQNVLAYVLSRCMQLLHPFMPFITEEIWQSLPGIDTSIMVSDFPVYDEALDFGSSCDSMERIIAAIKSIRNVRRDMDVPPSRKAALYIDSDYTDSFNEETAIYFTKLAFASSVEFVKNYQNDKAVQAISSGAKCYIPLADIIDVDKELARLEKEKEKAMAEVALVEKKLSNESFVSRAPAAVVDGERAKLEKHKQTLANVLESIANLKK